MKQLGGKGNYCCEGGNTVVSSVLPFSFVFALKETSGWPEVSQWRRADEWSHHMVACMGGGVLWHQNTKTCTRL